MPVGLGVEVIIAATRPGSKKCETCRVVEGVCAFDKTPVFTEGQKSYGFEHPIQEVPTDDFDSEVRSVLKKAGIPTGGIPILSREWTNHEGVVSNQVGSSECSARSQLRWAKEVSATQHAKRQKVKPSNSSKEDGGIDRHGNTAETEDDKYRPPIEVPNPPQGEFPIPLAGKYPANQSTSSLQAPLPHPPKIVSPGVRGVTPGVDDLEPWVPEGSELESKGFTHDRRLAMALLVDTHYQLGQGIRELIRGNPTKRFMELAAVSDQMELEMTEMIKEMGSWLEHLELNGMVPYEAWNGSKGKGRDEGDPEE
ncbi:hypothetical protein PPACK8108_LOCUS661 [Phakopsora pachyrhizi]|uniref:Uncharacterized protein n=1 Tax=Phakopsora pachyrhizi TaxID=170000 RepID=A0AAV0AF73_PHAPC|nr:hypothetical protein PPACK8108_LOCUS661 [Phakopsora pachyrhizi]